MSAVTKRKLKNEVKSPIEEQLYDSLAALLVAHDRLKICRNLLHSLLLEKACKVLDGVKYEPQGSLTYLSRKQDELNFIHYVAEQDSAGAASDEEAQLVIHRESERFADALTALTGVTKTHLLLQLHFELLALYAECYEESRILPLSRLRDAFFDAPTVTSLERYLIQAERLEERGVAVSEFRVLFSVSLGTKSGAVTSARSAIESRRDLLDELWAHSVLGLLPQEGRIKSRSLALAAKRPHPGAHLQPFNGVVPRRGA